MQSDHQTLLERIRQLEKEKEILRLQLWRHKQKPSDTIGYIFLFVGATALASSIIYASSILAFIGLGLIFWGGLLFFVKPIRYVKARLLDPTAISTLTTIDRVIADLNYKGKGIHLPPRYLKGLKEGTVFISSEKNIVIPAMEKVNQESVFLKNPKGFFLTPPGLGLANLFETELGTNFAKVNLKYLQDKLPKLFMEGLEIAEDFEMNMQSNSIQVRIKGSIYNDLCRETRRLPNIDNSIGCPLCSSIACILTRATGKPIIIDENQLSTDGKTIKTTYKIVEE